MLTDEIKARLDALSLVDADYTVFRGKMPATPDEVVVLRETGGTAAERFMGGTASIEQPSLQVIVRGAPHDYDGPRLVADTIWQAMVEWGAFTADGTRYVGLTPLQSVFPLRDGDENHRKEFSMNFLVLKEMS
jgi:hypothetical protein